MSTTRETYDLIAAARYNFRHYSIFRTELEELAKRWRQGKLLNVGCAHGPDFLPFKERSSCTASTFSTEMLKLAQKYAAKYQFRST